MQPIGQTAVVTQLEQEWPLLAHTAFAHALPGWRERARALRRFESPCRLLRFLHAAPPHETNAPLLSLLHLARDDRLAGRFVLQAILPALRAQARRLAHSAERRDEVWELVLFHAWEAICAYPPERRTRVAANLVLQVLHDTTRELRRSRSQVDISRASGNVEQLPAFLPPHPSRMQRLVAAGARAGVIGERDASLILQTRVDGVDLQALAIKVCVPYPALRKRRARAERALRRWAEVQGNVPTEALSDLTSSATSPWRSRHAA